ncbi:hypothetical protein ZWY2020_056813 [Hordeum vulgare]|nr:hypothetical protein ZWY2020_056813 [Hordeum vulgare]
MSGGGKDGGADRQQSNKSDVVSFNTTLVHSVKKFSGICSMSMNSISSDPAPGLAIVIMGVSGCGKSTVATMLADVLGCGFVDADDHHSHANKEKMSKGVPLTDEDRLPWLESLRNAIRDRLGRSPHARRPWARALVVVGRAW